MVSRETCPHCKGNRYVSVEKSPKDTGRWIKCPTCGGQGYKVRLTK